MNQDPRSLPGLGDYYAFTIGPDDDDEDEEEEE